MVWLVTFIVIAMLLAPVMWMMPSRQQKRQICLRERARQHGLQVSIGELPQTRRQRVRREAVEMGVAYLLRTAREKGAVRSRWLLWRDPSVEQDAGGLPVAIAARVEELRSRMPADMLALEAGAAGYTAYWRERGDEETVDRIAALLQEVCDLAGGELLRE